MAKPMNKEERAYANWLAEGGCLISGKECQLHHEFPAGGRKNHKHLIPLSPEFHEVGNPFARHELGRAGFADYHADKMDGLTCQEWAERSYRRWKER